MIYTPSALVGISCTQCGNLLAASIKSTCIPAMYTAHNHHTVCTMQNVWIFHVNTTSIHASQNSPLPPRVLHEWKLHQHRKPVHCPIHRIQCLQGSHYQNAQVKSLPLHELNANVGSTEGRAIV